MHYKVYHDVSADVRTIREEVFIEEQGFENEFDCIDKTAQHIVLYMDTIPVATCRVFAGTEDGVYILGRLAVRRHFRGRNLGAEMLKEAEKLVIQNGGNEITLHAQCRVKAFYEKSGYEGYGEVDEDEGCPHIWMRKKVQ